MKRRIWVITLIVILLLVSIYIYLRLSSPLLSPDNGNCQEYETITPCQNNGCTWCSAPGVKPIPGYCSSLNEPGNCGKCGLACYLGQFCQKKETTSECVCPDGQIYCSSFGCVDQQTNPSNCGGCSIYCSSRQICVSGNCQCLPGLTWCDGSRNCQNLQNDKFNCGSCGNICLNIGEICSKGVCVSGSSGTE